LEPEIQTGVILVGGAGLRMRPLTQDVPKAMIKLHGKPLLYWTLNWLKKYRLKHVVLGVAYRKEVIIDYVQKNPFGLDIDFSVHTVEGGTGEGFRLAIERYVDDENFLAMNGDELTNLNLEKLIDFHLKDKPIATIAISPMRSPYGIIEIRGNTVIGFKEKTILEDKLVSVGIYIFNHGILDYLPTKGALETTAFPLLAQKGLLKAYRLSKSERWITINTIKDLSIAEEEFEFIRGL
jgi:NDP-sugar pyrophosphorylase family protein